MTFASCIRQFFVDLFGHRTSTLYVNELKERLAKAEETLDYFRDKADRLELRLIPPPVVRGARSPADLKPVGRKTWAQVQAEHGETLKKQADDEAAAKAAQGAN
jgi:hypothetical protein